MSTCAWKILTLRTASVLSVSVPLSTRWGSTLAINLGKSNLLIELSRRIQKYPYLNCWRLTIWPSTTRCKKQSLYSRCIKNGRSMVLKNYLRSVRKVVKFWAMRKITCWSRYISKWRWNNLTLRRLSQKLHRHWLSTYTFKVSESVSGRVSLTTCWDF